MQITIRRPDDFHVHFRQGPELGAYVRDTAAVFARALAMPNTVPQVSDPDRLSRYRAEITAAAPDFTPLMSFTVGPELDRVKLEALAAAGAVAGKLYPRGATTNSEHGVEDVRALVPVFSEMARLGLVLCIHAEDPTAPVLDREEAFLPAVEEIVRTVPELKAVLEHLSGRAALALVTEGGYPNLSATVTAHHLLLTLDDLLGGKLAPHNFCKPVVKTADDREALRQAVFSGDGRLFFGSDSAPHSRAAKECASGAAGIYSAPVALPLLAELFERNGALDRLGSFVSLHGARFYGLPENPGTVTLEKTAWRIPDEYHGVVPLRAGTECSWKVVAVSED